jgi:hypothetical protein
MDDAIVDMSELPGEGLVFEDVTSVFANALQGQSSPGLILDGFQVLRILKKWTRRRCISWKDLR